MGKMKTKTVSTIMKEYDEKYGEIPLDFNERLEYLLSKYKKVNFETIEAEIKRIQSIEWAKEEYIIPIIPKPAARPRYSFETTHFYVPGSSSNKTIMKKILGVSDQLIMARTKLTGRVYQPTPCYKMTQNEIYLAELGYIRPVIDPDIDNFAKSYLDAIQGVLIAEDNIVTNLGFTKYFSLKPRVEITIEYQKDFDSKYTEKVITERIKRLERKQLI